MNLVKIIKTKISLDKEKEEVKKMNELLDKCNQIYKTERIEAISILYQAKELYRKFLSERGTVYCSKNLVDEKNKLDELSDKIMNYDS